MTTTKLYTFVAPVFLLCTAFLGAAAAQSVQPNSNNSPMHVELRVLISTHDQKESGILPANLAAVSRQINEMIGQTDLRIAETYFGRIGDRGSMSHKSLANVPVHLGDNNTPSILEWSLQGVVISSDDIFKANSFKFGARVPIRGSNSGAEANAPRIVNYENIGVSLGELILSDSVPTLVGSLSLPNSQSTMFLVLTLSTGAK